MLLEGEAPPLEWCGGKEEEGKAGLENEDAPTAFPSPVNTARENAFGCINRVDEDRRRANKEGFHIFHFLRGEFNGFDTALYVCRYGLLFTFFFFFFSILAS